MARERAERAREGIDCLKTDHYRCLPSPAKKFIQQVKRSHVFSVVKVENFYSCFSKSCWLWRICIWVYFLSLLMFKSKFSEPSNFPCGLAGQYMLWKFQKACFIYFLNQPKSPLGTIVVYWLSMVSFICFFKRSVIYRQTVMTLSELIQFIMSLYIQGMSCIQKKNPCENPVQSAKNHNSIHQYYCGVTCIFFFFSLFL